MLARSLIWENKSKVQKLLLQFDMESNKLVYFLSKKEEINVSFTLAFLPSSSTRLVQKVLVGYGPFILPQNLLGIIVEFVTDWKLFGADVLRAFSKILPG